MTAKHLAITFLSPALFSLCVANQAFALTPSIAEVKDSRTTGDFFAECEVTLNLVGDEIADATSIRKVIKSATDDTGRDIRKIEDTSDDFEEISEYSRNKITLKFKNPARKASVIKELNGTIDLFIPKNDPQSIVTIPQALKQSGKKLTAPALNQNGIQLTFYTAADYTAFKKAEAEKEAAAQGLKNAMGDMFGSMFGGGDKNDITFLIQDPHHRITSFGFYSPSGEQIRNNGSMTSHSANETNKTISYSDGVPPDATLKIFLATEKAITSIPLSLKDIALP